MAGFDVDEVRAVARALREAPTDLKRQIRQGVRGSLRQSWETEIRQGVGTASRPSQANAVIAGPSRVNTTDREIRVEVTSTRKATRGGLVPAQHGRAVEFGSTGAKTSTYMSRRGSKRFQVKDRHTSRQLTPRRQRGSVFFPAAEEMLPRAVSFWMQTVRKTVGDALDMRR